MSFHTWTNFFRHQAAAAMEVEIPGRPKRKMVPRELADALNVCLCGQVLDSSLNGTRVQTSQLRDSVGKYSVL